ncbi:MAG TPA: CDP-diacylglycerol--glycerol-3-phosphate 3-phosphatidyltransferase [Actinocrinis sp.]|nr:CDP-diacylglycerol--glycerol-3-phosphate 3-phosphatidyltransferase [Actinocrinis sp.]
MTATDPASTPPAPVPEADAAENPAAEAGPGSAPAAPVGLWNIANILTVSRLLLVPVFAALLLHDGGRDTGWRLAAALVFMIATFTDRLDGELARKRGLITDFGKIADPIADKALMGTALVSLSALGELWWWVTVVILVRELGITLLRFWVIRYGVIAASRGGKLKTLLQALAIWISVLPLAAVPGGAWLSWIGSVIMGAALVVTVVTGADYVVKAVRLRRGAGAGTRAGTA